jgi:hypothetical protein
MLCLVRVPWRMSYEAAACTLARTMMEPAAVDTSTVQQQGECACCSALSPAAPVVGRVAQRGRKLHRGGNCPHHSPLFCVPLPACHLACLQVKTQSCLGAALCGWAGWTQSPLSLVRVMTEGWLLASSPINCKLNGATSQAIQHLNVDSGRRRPRAYRGWHLY